MSNDENSIVGVLTESTSTAEILHNIQRSGNTTGRHGVCDSAVTVRSQSLLVLRKTYITSKVRQYQSRHAVCDNTVTVRSQSPFVPYTDSSSADESSAC